MTLLLLGLFLVAVLLSMPLAFAFGFASLTAVLLLGPTTFAGIAHAAPGSELPLFAGAASKVLLAFQPPEELRELIRSARRRRGRGAGPVADLEGELERIRRQGSAFTAGEVVPDAWAVAVPLFDGLNRLAGGLSMAGPVRRLTSRDVEPVARRLIAAAEEISGALGASAPGTHGGDRRGRR
ncbi:MAG: hypothetical protein HYV93_13285 [Candidatus Rokubacteria bacterium]|nr:hypothetical protein [Candidatus Rokubacteria bacterium]